MNIKCPKCGVVHNWNYCPNCGAPSQQPQQPQNQQQLSYQQSPDKKPKKRRGCLFYVLITFAVLLFAGIIGASLNDDDGPTNSSDQSETTLNHNVATRPTSTPTPTLTPEQSFVTSISQDTGLKEETASNLYSVLTNELGFSNIKYISKSDYSDSVLIINADDYELTANLDDDEIYKIKCGSLTLYDDMTVKMDKNGVSDRVITDKYAYYSIAQEIVKSCLKSPKSADFPSIVWSPDEIAMQRNGDLVAVQSYVDAQNSFGAEIRSEFLVEFQVIDIDTYTYLPIYINIDGETSGEFIDLD